MFRYRQEGYLQGRPGCTWSRWLSGGSDFSAPTPSPHPSDSAQVAAMLPGRLEMHLSADAAPSASRMLRLGEGVTETEEREEPELQPESVSSHWRGVGVGVGVGRQREGVQLTLGRVYMSKA